MGARELRSQVLEIDGHAGSENSIDSRISKIEVENGIGEDHL